MNARALEAQMVLHGIRVPDLCAQVGISESAFYRKKAGVSEFTQSEIAAIAKACGMSKETILSVFFADEVSFPQPGEAQ